VTGLSQQEVTEYLRMTAILIANLEAEQGRATRKLSGARVQPDGEPALDR
jgi:hypothetical protein